MSVAGYSASGQLAPVLVRQQPTKQKLISQQNKSQKTSVEGGGLIFFLGGGAPFQNVPAGNTGHNGL